jgi:nucleotide-binding universal stress UspA family protein
MRAPVIVGFDGSRSAHAAVRYGADEAVLRDRELRIVHAFSWPLTYPPPDSEYDPHERGPRVVMLNRLTQTARDVQQDHPHLPVSTRLFDGSPTAAQRMEAGLLVVGSRGVGGFHGLMMGSTSRSLIEHASCPVMVIPAAAHPRLTPMGVSGIDTARRPAPRAVIDSDLHRL